MPKHKRHRGGQPGNQNARKHGFYSEYFDEKQIAEFRELVDSRGIDPQVAFLQVKFLSALPVASDIQRVLRESAKAIYDRYNDRYQFTGEAAAMVKKYLRRILQARAHGDLKLTEQIIAEAAFAAENLQNDLDSRKHNTNFYLQNDSSLLDIIQMKNGKTNRI